MKILCDETDMIERRWGRLTTAAARRLGWIVTRGAYVGTCDDRAERWYAYRADGPVRRLGDGYRTRRDALAAVAMATSAEGYGETDD